MSLNLEDQKEHLYFLTTQSEKVLKHFCQLVSSSFKNELGSKDYKIFSKQYELESYAVKNAVECLVHLIIEHCKMKLQESSFCEVLESLGFNTNQQQIIKEIYNQNKNDISKHLPESITEYGSQYDNLSWRFEVQVGSRTALKQTVPLVSMDLSLKCPDENKKHFAIQTDPNNLQYLAQELEMALQEGRSHHARNVSKVIK